MNITHLKALFKAWRFRQFQVRQLWFFLWSFSQNDRLCLVKSSDQFLIKYLSSTVAYRDCGLSLREIGSLVGRNQTTVMRICDRWMQEGTMDQRGLSHLPQCTTSRENRQIVRMTLTDHSVTSRTVAQHIESVTHHSVSARTIQCRLQQSGLSARRPLLGLPLTQNHRRLRRQWYDERRMWAPEWNEVVFTNELRICLQHHDGRIRVWRPRGERLLNRCVMHRHTGPAPGIMVWGGIGYHSRTPLVRITGSLNSQRYISEVLEPDVLPYLQGLATAIFQQDNARPHVARILQRFFVNLQIELLPWQAHSPDLSR
ncbi:transposable element Tcb1 transposase [Trichonephila clavipes]|nr:transposable element Tcb1 transposase [Trichonephila clavipes]